MFKIDLMVKVVSRQQRVWFNGERKAVKMDTDEVFGSQTRSTSYVPSLFPCCDNRSSCMFQLYTTYPSIPVGSIECVK